MKTARRKIHIRRRICGVIAFSALILMLGSVGGMEHFHLGLGRGSLYAFISLVVFAAAAYKSRGLK